MTSSRRAGLCALLGLLTATPARAAQAVIDDMPVETGRFSYGESDAAKLCRGKIAATFPQATDPAATPEYAACMQELAGRMAAAQAAGGLLCEADVHIPRVSGVPAAPAINEKLAQSAEMYRCRLGVTEGRLNYRVTYNSGRMLSVVFTGIRREVAAGSACHAHVYTATFDNETGEVLGLKQLVPPERTGQLREYMADQIAGKGTPAERSSARREMLAGFDRLYPSLSFYIEDRGVTVDTGQAVYGCAAGPSNPVRLAKEFINDFALPSPINR